ncbi:hypothetical protein EBB07_29275 [Paenibacillaceae bacterium]|nr:hypothetical protein EBB07_29275 [Paenibacillaceae bacterium]
MKITKLNDLLSSRKLTVLGFPAFQQLAPLSNQDAVLAVLSVLPAPVVAEQGYTEYYAPRIPRGAKYASAEDVLAADLDVDLYQVHKVESAAPVIIVTQHQAAIDLLLTNMPELSGTPIITGNASVEDVAGKHVYGQLPPFMLAHCDAYTTVTVPGFDAAKHSDMSVNELLEQGLQMQIKGAYRVTAISG